MVDSDLERLAEIHAKKRVNSWSEQFKSPWNGTACALAASWWILWLPFAVAYQDGGVGPFIAAIAGFGWFCRWLYKRHKRWEKRRYDEFYEEELLELKVKKES